MIQTKPQLAQALSAAGKYAIACSIGITSPKNVNMGRMAKKRSVQRIGSMGQIYRASFGKMPQPGLIVFQSNQSG